MEEMNQKSEELHRIVQLSYLFDFYGMLLKDTHREIFEDYILNDMSLGEIAIERGITRQGVHDIVKRCSKRLMEYEDKLCLVEKFRITKEKLNDIEKIALQENGESARKIIALTHEIYDVI